MPWGGDEGSALAFAGSFSVWGVKPGCSAEIVVDGEFPAAFVELVVVGDAEQVEVDQVGFPAVQPVQAMVGFGPGRRPVTVRADAPAVAGGQPVTQAVGDDPGGRPKSTI